MIWYYIIFQWDSTLLQILSDFSIGCNDSDVGAKRTKKKKKKRRGKEKRRAYCIPRTSSLSAAVIDRPLQYHQIRGWIFLTCIQCCWEAHKSKLLLLPHLPWSACYKVRRRQIITVDIFKVTYTLIHTYTHKYLKSLKLVSR